MSPNYIIKHSVKKTFIFFLLIPLFLQIVVYTFIKNLLDINLYFFAYCIFAILYLPYFYWLNSAVKYLYSKFNTKNKLKIIRFKVAFYVNIISVFNFVFIIAYIFRPVFHEQNFDLDNGILLSLGAIQFVGVISFVYSTYFVIRLLNIDSKRCFIFSNIIFKVVFLSYPPIALWVIQTQIRKTQIKL
jgi:hypothetical protein